MTSKCGLCKTETDKLYPTTFRGEELKMCKECQDALRRDTLLHNKKVQAEGKKSTNNESRDSLILKKMQQLARDSVMRTRLKGIAHRKKVHAERQALKQVHKKTITKPTQQQKFNW